jgi:hypothetical protein
MTKNVNALLLDAEPKRFVNSAMSRSYKAEYGISNGAKVDQQSQSDTTSDVVGGVMELRSRFAAKEQQQQPQMIETKYNSPYVDLPPSPFGDLPRQQIKNVNIPSKAATSTVPSSNSNSNNSSKSALPAPKLGSQKAIITNTPTPNYIELPAPLFESNGALPQPPPVYYSPSPSALNAAKEPVVLHQGYMNKMGRFNKVMKRRYFILREDRLSYYVNEMEVSLDRSVAATEHH